MTERKNQHIKRKRICCSSENHRFAPDLWTTLNYSSMTHATAATSSSEASASRPWLGTGGPAAESDGGVTMATLSVGLIVLIVLATLCAILGAIYAYIYYTRINPRSARARKYVATTPQEEDGDNKSTHVHMFLFRKS